MTSFPSRYGFRGGQMAIEVLVVDDVADAGRSFARYIQGGTGLETGFTDDPQTAIDLAKKYHLKVVVLDQKMPQMTGTELFKRLRQVEPQLRGILFSGLADTEDVAQAVELKFAKFMD